MNPDTEIAVDRNSEREPLKGGFARLGAIAEVSLAFGLVHVSYRALKYFTIFGQWDAQTNFIPGLTMLAFTIAILLLFRRSFTAYGLGVEHWSYNLNLGLVCIMMALSVIAAGLTVTKFHFDAGKPPDPHAPLPYLRLAGFAAVALPAFIIVLRLLRKKHGFIERIPPAFAIPAILALLALPSLIALYFHRPAMWLQALWLFFGAGFGEEIFFRGYIQSRVDQAFGCPLRLVGFDFGVGLLVSSLFFGLIHALNTVDYFHGRLNFGWWYGVQNIFTGLFFGCVRARTGNILPGAIIHGLQDAFARIPNLLS